MELAEVLEHLKNPENLADPRLVDQLIFEVSGYIGDYEEQLAEVDQRVAVKLDELATKWETDAAGKRKLALEPIYIEQKKIERRIRQFKGFRTNLKRRYEILTNRFR